MHKGRFTDMRCPDSIYFDIDASEEESSKGSECITINGGGIKMKKALMQVCVGCTGFPSLAT